MPGDSEDKPKLSSVYAPGFVRWIAERRAIRENAVLVALASTFALAVGVLIAVDLFLDHSSLAYRIAVEVIVAVLVATTVGLFYELVARRNMVGETVKLVRGELQQELALLRESRIGAESGLIGFGPNRQYIHQDVTQYLSAARRIDVLAIHGTRLWGNRELERAILDNPALELRALLLKPDSPFVEARVAEHPEAYDRDVMAGEIVSCIQKLRKWQNRKDGLVRLELYDYPPSFWLVFVDNILYLSAYERRRVSQDSPVFKFDSRPGSLYHVFSEHFERIWDQAAE